MNHQHFMIYKPDGYLSQFKYEVAVRKNKKTLKLLGDFPEGTMAVGRLDQDSEGLLLLTTDGKFSEKVRSKKVEKEYWVQVDGLITSQAIERLREGVEISVEGSPYLTLPAKANIIELVPKLPLRNKKIRDDRHGPSSWVSISITEGKFRQVRKMTAAVGFPTLRLVRVRIGELSLQNLQPFEIKEVSEEMIGL